MRHVDAALSLDGTLSKPERRKREVFLLFGSLVFLGCVSGVVSAVMKQNYFVALGVSLSILFVTSLAAILTVLCKRPVTIRVVLCTLYAICVAVFITDLNSRTVSRAPQWPLLVLMTDTLLVLQVPQRFTAALVWFTVAWLILLALEESFRFGLLDLPGLIPQEGERGRREYFVEMVSCDALPCPVKFPPTGLVSAIAIFVTDYLVTRGFAHKVLTEQASMQKTIEAVQEIASLLAKYDVEGVARMLKVREAELPEQMYETLQTMEENLRMYRPYLPAALFEEMEMDECGESKRRSVAPPGVLSETATIVFTDIRSSTWIWEHAPEGMRAGLKIHNSVMREVMQAFGGYEVKTIGDAFMIAFASTEDGVNFGLRVHELLREALWPDSLLEDAPICAEQGSLWGGLTVRIGVNTGPVTVEQNALTGRTDYFGHTVNVASRLESTCKPGAVAVPSDLYTSECRSCSAVVGDAEALDLKGVSGTTFVQCVWPLSLAGRKYKALREPLMGTDAESEKTVTSARTDSGSITCVQLLAVATHPPFLATVGVVQLLAGEEGCPSALRNASNSLSALTVSLDQSRGTLVTLLDNRVCVGWNLTRPAPAHMENAIRFAQRAQLVSALSGAGLVSGPVQHGDVGARKQRFVTVVGKGVQRSWTLCDEAVLGGGLCLYEAPAGSVLPSAFDQILKAFLAKDVYTVEPGERHG